MLDAERLDFVSVCTWTGQHREMIEAAAGTGVKAIHSEKPMAPTWGDAKALYQACVDRDVVISFCHQRRFGAQFIKAKQLLDEGAIGKLERVEGSCSNLFDWGTHWFDMFFFYNNDEPAEWVIGQIAVEEDSHVFGVALETSGLSWIRWHNGVEGLLATGNAMIQGPRNRLRGSDGVIEIGGRDRSPLRILRTGGCRMGGVLRRRLSGRRARLWRHRAFRARPNCSSRRGPRAYAVRSQGATGDRIDLCDL